jgi:hypothetical protein
MNAPDTIPEIIQSDEDIPEQVYLDKVTDLYAELWDALAHPYQMCANARSKVLALHDELDADQRPLTFRELIARHLEATYERFDAFGDCINAIMHKVDPEPSEESDDDA